MERQLPKNVRQIGNVSDSPKIYVEDYVDTFFTQQSDKCVKEENGPEGVFLIGDILTQPEGDYVYVYGAIQIREIHQNGNGYEIPESSWKQAYEECGRYFEEGEIIGWFVANKEMMLAPGEDLVRMHKSSFPKENTILILREAMEKEDAYYVHKMGDLMEIGGHYTYYERNPCMQNYMIYLRKKNGMESSESVEDRATKNFRSIVRSREKQVKKKKAGSFKYAASAFLVLVVVVAGASVFNNFGRMRAVQNTLDNLEEQENTPNVQETGGEVQMVSENQEEEDMEFSEETEGESGNGTGESEEGSGKETNLQDQDNLSKGDSQSGKEVSGSISESAEDGIYVVEKGDTLAIISRKMYGTVSYVDAICRMNGITDGNLIYVGQKLLLP